MSRNFDVSAELAQDIAVLSNRARIAGGAALALCAVGAFVSPDQFLRSYLVGYLLVLGVVLGSLAILMLHQLTGGSWGLVIRRVLEAATRTVPLMAVLFLPLALGVGRLYKWADRAVVSADHLLQIKSAYLNVPFFMGRAVLYFGAWSLLAYLMNKFSAEQDAVGAHPASDKLQKLAGPGLLVYGGTITFAAIDWIMSLDPHWSSTMLGILVMGGQCVSALAFVIAITVFLARRKPMCDVITPAHLHDLGKLMFAFVMLWAYFSFSQLLIIWSANLPEEIPWYLRRFNHGWQWVGLTLIVFHFALPFVLLLSRDIKRDNRQLTGIAIWLLIMRLTDLFFLVAPEFSKDSFAFHWLDPMAPIGLGGIWLSYFLTQLKRRALMPVHDPNLEEALEHEPAH
ncbi:MAG: hypothetical protein EXQ52_15105 [Bryobacterales bacterium]|nr:hypothetical protein [Bryobacterales bacterium]